MPPVVPPVVSLAVYAKDIACVSSFYAAVVGLREVERASGFILLAGPFFELAVVQVPAELAAAIHIASPPTARADTPIKPSFLVSNIEKLRREVQALGGLLKPAPAAWSWRGQLHLDGKDPEGNVFQLRQSEA
jgi:predicted enzyme related to lactoylglutathione lyase